MWSPCHWELTPGISLKAKAEAFYMSIGGINNDKLINNENNHTLTIKSLTEILEADYSFKTLRKLRTSSIWISTVK